MKIHLPKLEMLAEGSGQKTRAAFIKALTDEAVSRGMSFELYDDGDEDMLVLIGSKIKNPKIMGMTVLGWGHVRFEEPQLAEHFENDDPAEVVDMYIKCERKGASAVF